MSDTAKAGVAFVEVVGDFSKLKRQLNQQMAAVGNDKVRVGVEFDNRKLDAFERSIKQVGDRVRRKPITAKLDVEYDRTAFDDFDRDWVKRNAAITETGRSARGASRGMDGFAKSLSRAKIPFLSFSSRVSVISIATMGTAAIHAAGGIISLTSALAPMTGLLGAVGPLATAAAQGLGSIKLATSGVGDAISAAFAEQDKAAVSTTASLQAQEGAAEAVREAHLSLAAAQRTVKGAQEDLTSARADATREIEDMKVAVRDLALEEEGASLSLREAKEAFAELSSSGAGELEIERAALRIKEARAELKKTRQEGKRAQQDLGGVNLGGGVKGMPQVVSARQGLEDANRGVAEAERELAKAVKQSSQAMSGGGAAADVLAAKMNKLPPAARQFAQFIIGLRPKIKQLQATAAAGLFPGVERGITAAMKNLPVLNRIVGRTAEAFGDLAEKAGNRLGSDAFGKDLETQGARNEKTIRRLGEAGLDLVGAFRHITLAAGPMVDRLTKWVGTLTDTWRESAKTGRETGTLQAFFKDAGDTFFKVTRIVRDLAVSFKNIGSAARQAFGNELLGNIGKGARLLREWTGSVQGQRELVSVFRDIGDNLKNAGRFIREITEDFRQMKKEGKSTGDALSHIFVDVFASLVANGAEFGAKMAVGFVKGFVKADIWGKLIAGALIATKLAPLIALFRTQGVVAGAAMGEGVAVGATTGIVGGAGAGAAGGLLARLGTKLLPIAKRVGIVGLGIALADTTLKEFERRAALKGPDAFKALESVKPTSGILGDLPLFGDQIESIFQAVRHGGQGDTDNEKRAERIQKALKGIVETGKAISPKKVQELREEIGKLSGVSDKAKRSMLGILDASQKSAARIFTNIGDLSNVFDKVGNSTSGAVDLAVSNIKLIGDRFGFESKRGSDAVRDNMKALSAAIRDNMKEGRSSVREGFEAMRGFAITNSRAVAGSAQKNFGAARNFIRDAIKDGTISTRRGMKLIRELWFAEMAFYGFSKKDALNIRKARSTGGKEGVLNDFSPRGVPHRRQRGGPIDMGAATGDTVPAVLERGEYVLNRKAVQRIGRDQLDRVNFKKAPRFQKGGIVALGRKLQREGYVVGEHPAFGGVDAVHDPDSWHYKGKALDINADQWPGGEKAALDKLYGRLKGMPGVIELLWQVAGHFDHLHVAMGGKGDLSGLGGLAQKIKKIGKLEVTGPNSGVKAIVQSGLDGVRKAANSRLKDAAAESSLMGDVGEPVFGVGPKKGAASRAQMVRWARQALDQTNIFPVTDENVEKILTLAMAESSWITDSLNTYDINAQNGMPSGGLMHITVDKVGYDFDRLYDPVDNIATSIRYQKSRYGELVTHSPYAKGGLVGYVGDSLGVGTAPKLKGRIGDLIANVAESRTSAQGLKALKGMLGKKYARYIWDLGTNDGDAGAVKSNLKAADKATGDRLLLASTVTGANAKAKNSALRALAGGDINLFEWAKRSAGILQGGDVHPPDGAAYGKRAAMMAGALSAATSRHKGKGKDEGKLPKLKGSLTHKARQTAKALAASKDKQRRAKILKRFQKHLKKYGLPNKLLSEINFLSAAHDRFADFATEAAAGDIENDDGSVVRGLINGKNEGGWLTEDLGAMFKARNKLVKARDIVTRNQKKVQSTLGFVNEQLKNLSKDGKTPRGWKGVDPAKDAVEKWNKQPAPKRHRLMKQWRGKHGQLPGTREFNTFTGKIKETPKSRIPALRTVRGKLRNQNTLLKGAISPEGADGASIIPQLEGLQGFGPPGILKSPWPLGTIWGGDIRSTQLRMLELFRVPPKTTDDTKSDDARVALLEQQHLEDLLRLRVSERSFDVLRNFPPFGGQFATGGTVPGPAGAPRTVIAHGGEKIIPEGKGGAAAPNVYVNFDGKVSFLRDFVDVRIEQQTRRATGHSRVLPGRKGG